MMPNKGSSQKLLEETQALHGALNTIRVKIPSLIVLTPAERKQARGVNERQLTLMNNCLEAVQNKTVSLPATFGVAEFVTQVRASLALHESLVALKQLVADVQDTFLAVGSEAFKASYEVAVYAKTAARRTPGLKAVAERLNAPLSRRSAQAQAREAASAPEPAAPVAQHQPDTPVTPPPPAEKAA